MTHLLNTISHIPNYAGIGMLIFAIGLFLIIFSIIRISKQREVSRRVAVAEFNQHYAQDTGARISDIESGDRRRDIARDLGIGR